jgi:hypothetical protein
MENNEDYYGARRPGGLVEERGTRMSTTSHFWKQVGRKLNTAVLGQRGPRDAADRHALCDTSAVGAAFMSTVIATVRPQSAASCSSASY